MFYYLLNMKGVGLGVRKSRHLPRNDGLSSSTQLPAQTFRASPSHHSLVPPTEAACSLGSAHHHPNQPKRSPRIHVHHEATTPSERSVATQAHGRHDDETSCFEVSCRHSGPKCPLFIALKRTENQTKGILRGIVSSIH